MHSYCISGLLVGSGIELPGLIAAPGATRVHAATIRCAAVPLVLDAAGVEVTGFPVAESFAEIGCFV